MYQAKRSILKSFNLVVAVAGRAALLAMLAVLAAQALATVEHLEKYASLNHFFRIEQQLEKPVTAFLRANMPVSFNGFDVSPFLIVAALLILTVLCESERYRLRILAWRLKEERDTVEAKSAFEREKKMLRAEIEAAQKAAADKVKADALARAEAEGRARAEAEVRARSDAGPAKSPAPVPPAAGAADGSERERLLELYAQTKKTLEEQKKDLSFLAVDVVNSTGMKHGEDSALAERDFRQYKKLVERSIAANKGLKAAWTPDGVMICFASVQDAVRAAQDLIRGLDHFNRSVKTIKADFKVRCGINAGKVLFDESVRMEEMTDRNIDIAGHMQKYAEPSTIYIGAHAIEGLREQFGFRAAQKQVDGCDVYEWRHDGASETASEPTPAA